MITSTAFTGKHFAVLGLARSGLAAAEALLAGGAHIVAWDRQEPPREALIGIAATFGSAKGTGLAQIADLNVADLTGLDGIVVSPGVPLNTHPVAERARTARVPLIGDIELFSMARPALPPHRVIGITGTNGKSTTTALVHHLLEQGGIPARMGGNIGLPILAQEALLPRGDVPGVYVLELSSYQLDLTRSLACEAAALTNITPDHLDRYDSFDDYAFAKARLFGMQDSGQFAVFGCADAPTRAVMAAEAMRRPPGRAIAANLAVFASYQTDWPSLQGPHNLQNAAVAAALVQQMGLSCAQVLDGLASFAGLPHRMERLGAFDEVLFVNDSKSTNPASTAPALLAFPPDPKIHGGTQRIHWICGGLPKSDDLDECAPGFGNLAAAYTIGEAGPLFAEILASHCRVARCEMLCEAVTRAMAAARPGDVILLSPACASFDQFRNYEVRGDDFRNIVTMLTGLAASAARTPLHSGSHPGRAIKRSAA